MRNIKDINISSCFPLAWFNYFKKEVDYNKLVYVGKKRVRHRYGGKVQYSDEYVYWYPETVFGISLRPLEDGEYLRSAKLIEEIISESSKC